MLGLLLVTGIGCASEEPFRARQIEHVPPPLPPFDASRMNDAGVIVFAEGGPLSLGYVRTNDSPLAAMKTCFYHLTSCFEAGQGAQRVDDCFHSVPDCAQVVSDAGSASCCPAACSERYASLRKAGFDAAAALNLTLNSSACFGAATP